MTSSYAMRTIRFHLVFRSLLRAACFGLALSQAAAQTDRPTETALGRWDRLVFTRQDDKFIVNHLDAAPKKTSSSSKAKVKNAPAGKKNRPNSFPPESMWQFFDGTHEPELPTTGSLIAHGQTVIDWNTLDPANQSTWDRLTKDKTPLFPDSSVMLRATNTHSNQLYFVPASVHFLNSSLAAHPSNQLRDVLETYTANYTDFEFKASGQTGADNLARGQSRVHQALAQEALKSLNDLSKLFLLAKTDLKVKQETAVLGNFDLQLKTLYLHDDVFETSSYQRVLDNASRIAGFFDSPSALGTVRAAGIFVGPNVVLTCQHCLAVLHPGTSAICRRIPGSTSPIVYLYKNPLPDYRRASA